MKYSNFDIRISGGAAGRFQVRAESNHGEVDAEIALDPAAPGMRDTIARLAGRQTDRDFLEALGTELYQGLFAGDVGSVYDRSFGEVASAADHGLRVRLRIGEPALAALPWELLFSRLDGQFIGTRVGSPLVRYLDMPGYKRDLSTPWPLRILAAIPQGSDPALALDTGSEKKVIEQALAGMGDKVRVTYLDELHDDGRVTWRRIHEQLREADYHCLHFIGHGTFRDDRGHLVLDGEGGADDVVPDERFADLFAGVAATRLVVLNACKGAALSSSRPLAGSGARLVEHGVPAVVAMQFSIYDTAAIDFARSFYHSLFRSTERGRVDVAVSQGRQVLEANYRDQRELAAPVLFMHTDTGMLFMPEPESLLEKYPVSTARMDTMQAAREATGSDAERRQFGRRIAVAKAGLMVLCIALVTIFLSFIRVLDLFTIDTRAEFLAMALGNGLVDHRLSEDLRIVTIDAAGLDTPARRQRLAAAVENLAAAGAGTIALDVYYPAENDDFKTDPGSGQELVRRLRDARDSRPDGLGLVAGFRDLDSGGHPMAPRELAAAVDGLGHICYESKLGLARSLPIVVSSNTRQYPALALAAFATFNGGNLLTRPDGFGEGIVVAFTDRQSTQFAVSEIYRTPGQSRPCPVIGADAEVAHRFLRLTPRERFAPLTMTDAALAAAQPSELAQFAGKLVLIGQLGVGDEVDDWSGTRDGVLWQADALNNLLLDEAIVPLRYWHQFLIMAGLAGLAVFARIRFHDHPRRGLAGMLVLTVAIILAAVLAYAHFNLLTTPAYLVLAPWIAWYLARIPGKQWTR